MKCAQLLSTKTGELLKGNAAQGLKAAADLGFDPIESVDHVVLAKAPYTKEDEDVYFIFGKFEFKKMLDKATGSLKDLPGAVSFEGNRLILKIPKKTAGMELYVTHLTGPGTGFVASLSKKKLLAIVSPGGLPTKELKPRFWRGWVSVGQFTSQGQPQ